jgi:4a-hydroxytetrahydrobiopterin dehydratase
MRTPLSRSEIENELVSLPGWVLECDALAKTYGFADFRTAMGFMVRVGFEAEELNHHPEWTNIYKTVAVRLSTHDAGGKVTELDCELARRMDRLARQIA